MSTFTEAVVDTDATILEQEVIDEFQAQYEEWDPAEGGLATWLIKAFARISSTVLDQAAATSVSIFARFGETVAGVPPILAAPAYVESTWTMVDAAGYTIPAGTLVSIEVSGDETAGFEVAEDVTVTPEDEATAAGEVVLRAVISGEAGNGLSAAPTLLDSLAYVESIELTGVTAGGVDEESEDDYLNRLVETLQLLSLSLIVGRDFEIDARAVAGIARAKAIEAYNADEAKEEALAVSVYGVDAAGAKLSEPIKTELKERQEAKVPSGVSVFVADPSYQAIKVKVQFKVETGFDPEAVEAAVEARLSEYLDPANWGVPSAGDSSTSGGWENRTTVYRFELVSEVDRVAGVDRVSLLELSKEADALGTADISMSGKVALTEPGTLTVEAV